VAANTVECLLAFDRHWKQNAQGLMAGVDEAGRGPLAGPVVAAAVILSRPFSLECLNDSKQVSARNREKLFWDITRHSFVGLGVATEAEIDSINIYQATRLAMKRAVLALTPSPAFILLDGNMSLHIPISQKAIVRGDAQSASIAAASIIAKVYRDAWMLQLDQDYPGYEFKKHKGYGTQIHLNALRKLGPSPVHRRSFSPVAAAERPELA